MQNHLDISIDSVVSVYIFAVILNTCIYQWYQNDKKDEMYQICLNYILKHVKYIVEGLQTKQR